MRSISATIDFPPLVGAQYTRFLPPSDTPGVERHSACHACNLVMFFSSR